MTKHHTRSPLALTAIAAVIALSATPALAQEAAPAAEPAPPPAVQPEIVIAPAPAPILVSEPMVQQVPPTPATVAEEAAPAAVAAPALRTRAATSARIAPVARVSAPSATASAVAPAVTAAIALPAPVAVAPVVAPVAKPVARPATEGLPSDETLLLGGLLAALGLGGAYALSRRRRVETPVQFERPVVAAAAPVPTSARFKPLIDAPAPIAPAIAQQIAGERLTASATGERRIERFAMPAGPVPQGDERNALIDRMVASPPDEANPFRSRKARTRRARIILQQREAAALKRAATEPFDWRSHANTARETAAARDLALV